jgi:hypothetical protein
MYFFSENKKMSLLLFDTCSNKLKKDENESSPHLVASTLRLFEKKI